MVRAKRRYIVFKVEYQRRRQAEPSGHDFMAEITNLMGAIYGDYGVACLKRNFTFKKQEKLNEYKIVQVRHGVHEMVMSVIPLITKVGEVPCTTRIVHLSGTLRASLKVLRLNYIRSLRETIGKKMAASTRDNKAKQGDLEDAT